MTCVETVPTCPRPLAGRAPSSCDAQSLELVRAAQNDRRRRAELIEEYRSRIASVARAYQRPGAIGREELMQQGVMGLLQALERYDPSRGTPFWAYASWWVRQAMQQLVAELSGPVVLSDRALREMARLRMARRAYLQQHRREPTRTELAAAADIDEAHIDRLTAAVDSARPLDEPVHEGEGHTRLGDMLPDPQGEDELARIPDRTAAGALPALLSRLDERERLIVCSHFGVGVVPRTLRQIAADLGFSAERARQIEQQALESLRAMVAAVDAPAPSAAVQSA